MLKKFMCLMLAAVNFGVSSFAHASLEIVMLSMQGKPMGYVRADDTSYGVMFTPYLQHLSPGIHGFHIHTCSSCAFQNERVDDHMGLQGIRTHNGPYKGNSHLGDLPVLIVNGRGRAVLPILAPRLKLENIKGRTLMIDAGGDNYSDIPKANGGGISRIACGDIPYY
jgi:Cu-Zn family superoxide dismutase